MRIDSKVCHLSGNKVIVQVIGWVNEKNVGSALAEAETVEHAEDKAILRLNKRLSQINKYETNIKLNYGSNNNNNHYKDETFKKEENVESIKIVDEPNDWSNELTQIDSEIKRLNWSREEEIKFLEKNLGYNNRSKITKYNELITYLNKLKKNRLYTSSKIKQSKYNKSD